MQNLNHTHKTCLVARLPDGQGRFTCRMALQALAITILIVTCTTSFAQNRNTIDSLKTIIYSKKAKDTTIIQTYIDLSIEYMNYNLDTALIYADHALNKSLKTNYKKEIAESYRQKGAIAIFSNNHKYADSLLNIAISIYREINYQYGIMKCYLSFSATAYYKGEYSLMLEYCNTALKIAEENNFIKNKADIIINIGVAYNNMGNYDKAIEYGLEALKISEECSDKINIASCKINIGLLLLLIEEFDKALKYLNEALKLCIELKHTRNQCLCLSNIGIVYYKQNKYDEALQNFNKAFELEKKNKYLSGLSASYGNIALVFYEQEKYNKAIEYHNKAIEIKKQIGTKKGIASCYFNIARNKIKQKEYKLAEKYCLKSKKLFEQSNELYNKQNTLEQLAIIYKLTGRYQKAYNTYFEAVTIKDSLFSIEKAQKIAQLEEKYLNENLEKQNLTLKYENEIQQSKINHHKKTHIIYFIVLFLAITAITIILIQYRKKNSAYKFLVRKNIDLLNKEKELKNLKEKITSNGPNNNRKITIDDNIKDKILKKLEQQLDNKKAYKDFDLTIDKLAKSISTNRNYLSQTIYKEYAKSYSDFINEYRVKESMLLLSNPQENSKLSIAGIGKEAGFRSAPRFICAFKKFTGITPSTFREESNTL